MEALEVLLWLIVAVIAIPLALCAVAALVGVFLGVRVLLHDRAAKKRRRQKLAEFHARRGAP